MEKKPIIEVFSAWNGTEFNARTRVRFPNGEVHSIPFKVGPDVDPVEFGTKLGSEAVNNYETQKVEGDGQQQSDGSNDSNDSEESKDDGKESDNENDSQDDESKDGKDNENDSQSDESEDGKEGKDGKQGSDPFWETLAMVWGRQYQPAIEALGDQ